MTPTNVHLTELPEHAVSDAGTRSSTIRLYFYINCAFASDMNEQWNYQIHFIKCPFQFIRVGEISGRLRGVDEVPC